jgi:hypothetical protein
MLADCDEIAIIHDYFRKSYDPCSAIESIASQTCPTLDIWLASNTPSYLHPVVGLFGSSTMIQFAKSALQMNSTHRVSAIMLKGFIKSRINHGAKRVKQKLIEITDREKGQKRITKRFASKNKFEFHRETRFHK